MRFVRQLAKLKVKGSLEIDGYYGEHWPGYSSHEMGVIVREAEREEGDWEELRKYQQGTEDLIP